MNYIFVLFVIFFFNTNLVRSDKSFVQYRWMLNDKWSSCSKKCDEGIEVRTPICVKNFIGQITGVDPSNCNPDEIPQNATRACNYGNCNDKYRWIVSKYGTCSQVCLDNGIIKRTVSCLPMYEEYNENSNLIPRIVDSNLCNPNKKPRNKDSCNRMDCEPDFKALEWGECDQNDVCVKGKQTRKVKCVIKKLDGKEEEVKLKYCTSLKKKKPKKWRQCTKNNSETCKMNEPEIDKDSITVVQMKRNRILNLKVGQNAFVIPLTKLTIHCPTTFFANQDLKWYHEKHGTIEYNGTSIERIKIDNEGRLIIENFKPIDKGLWFCKADSQSASITLAPRSVADGFLDWLRRNELMKNEQMLNEDPKTMHTYQEIIQWVEAPWNECPAKCGETSTQTRQVRCEKVKARSYEVLDDDACNERGLPKPKSSRECKIIDECPKLRFVPSNPEICSNECVKPGFAKVAGEYICELDEKVVSLDQCENVKIEDNFCENSSCKLKWQTGAWSKCNKECGENSYQSRSIKCIWESTQLSAGSLCLNENLTLPNAIKMCPNKPCTLECINMIKNCEDRKKLCRISMFQFYCCQTCKLYIEEIRSSN